MKINTAELSGAALDWAVATCENQLWLAYENALNNARVLPARPSEFLRDHPYDGSFAPSTDWSIAGPIIDREKISALWRPLIGGGCWWACSGDYPEDEETVGSFGATRLIATMRCFVASKLGDEVDVPGALL